MSAPWTDKEGRDGTDPRPWVWWSTGDKDASWQIGVALDPSGKQLAGELDADPWDDEQQEYDEARRPTVIDNICENPGSAVGLQNAALICEAVNGWSDPDALRARLASLTTADAQSAQREEA